MHPYLFRLPLPWGGTFSVPSYGVMILIGFLLCLWLLQRRGRRIGLDPVALFDSAVAGLLGGIVGARIFYVIDNWDQYAGDHWQVFRLDRGGLAFFGGLIGGGLTILFMLHRRRLPLRETLGVAATLVPLGHAFGRVGCFMYGCCYGRVTASWLGVNFPAGSPAYLEQVQQHPELAALGHSLPVYPTQLFAIAYNLAIFALLSWMLPRRRRAGDTAWLYVILYGSARFTNEFFRVEPRYASLGGLTLWQALCLAAVAFGVIMLVDSLRRPPEPLPAPWVPEEDKASTTEGT
jgi:phosphatidylglycerol:prolipoprotein diacylglycerol transferase